MRIGYARVSTNDQTLDQQTDALKAAGCERIYSETITSTKAMKSRPEWGRCDDALRPGDVLTVVRMDRLGRSLHDLLGTLEDLKGRGVKVESLSEEFGTGPAADLMLHMVSAFAQYERSLNSERTREKLKAARARGRNGGRPEKVTAPLERSMLVSLAADRTVSIGAIAKQFKVSRSTVYRIYNSARKAALPSES